MSLKSLKGIRELRFLICQNSSSSSGLRSYIANNYQAIRTSPATITIRQLTHISPSVIATYNYGYERKIQLKNKSDTQIQAVIQQLQSTAQQISEEIRI